VSSFLTAHQHIRKDAYFHGHSHCTKYPGQMSTLHEILASIIQGSAIGPASYVITAADLCSITPGNSLCKYADDTYIIIPAANVHSRVTEIDNMAAWTVSTISTATAKSV